MTTISPFTSQSVSCPRPQGLTCRNPTHYPRPRASMGWRHKIPDRPQEAILLVLHSSSLRPRSFASSPAYFALAPDEIHPSSAYSSRGGQVAVRNRRPNLVRPAEFKAARSMAATTTCCQPGTTVRKEARLVRHYTRHYVVGRSSPRLPSAVSASSP